MSSSSQGSFVAGEVHEPAETAASRCRTSAGPTAYVQGDARQTAPAAGATRVAVRLTAAARVAAPGRAGARRRSHTATVTGCRRRRDVGDRDGMDVLTR